MISKIKQWKDAFSKELHKKAKSSLDNQTDEIKQLRLKLQKPAQGIDTLGSIMSALEEIKINNSDIDLQFKPVTEMNNLLETHQTQAMDKDEGDAQNALEKKWTELVQISETTRNSLQGQQSRFKQTLIQGIKHLISTLKSWGKTLKRKVPWLQELLQEMP